MVTPTDARRRARLFHSVLRPLQEFFRQEAAGGVLLLGATVIALLWANSPMGDFYKEVFHLPISLQLGQSIFSFDLHALINDGLMAVFFFVVGMEIKRELAVGELRTVDRALLPAIAAVGGMVVPALVYTAFNHGTPAMRGWAIPMATDIAFAIGVVTVLKGRIPWALIVFLTALAIFDDMGGILVIALAYGSGIHVDWLLVSAGVTLALYTMGRSHVRNGLVWGAMGALLWFTLHHSGIHATLAGVILGLMVPARSLHSGRTVLEELHRYLGGILDNSREENLANEEVLQIEERLEDLEPPLNRFEHLLHPWVAYAVVPLFALANAGVDLREIPLSELWTPLPLGIALGLLVGKAVGIFTLTFAAVKLGFSPSPGGAGPGLLLGVSVVAGIGFTVALFMASLAFADDQALLERAKLGILAGSVVSAVLGYLLLRLFSKAPP